MRSSPIRCSCLPLPLRVTSLWLVLAISVACERGGAPRGAAPVESDSAGIRIVVSGAPKWPEAEGASPAAELAELTTSIGEEEGGEVYQLHRVSDAFLLADGSIAVSNTGSQELRVFDADGKHLRNIGRTGAGPGEFGQFSFPREYVRPGGHLVDDNGAFRVHLYDSAMEFLETRRFALTNEIGRPFLRGVFADGSWLAIAAEGGGAFKGAPGTTLQTSWKILRYDEHGAFVSELGQMAGATRYVNEVKGTTNFPFLPFSEEALLAAHGNEFVIFRGQSAELEVRDNTGKLVRLLRWRRERVPSAQLWPEWRDRSIAGLATSDERTRIMYGAYYARDLPLPEFAPLYTAMKVDTEGSVWLQRFRLPGDTTARVWDVIDRRGAWLGTVRTPPRLTVHRIGKDYVLGRDLDSLGVERVRLLPLKWNETP